MVTSSTCDDCSTSRFPFVWFWMCDFANSSLLWVFLVCWVLFYERNTSITTSHKSRAGNPSIRSPASNEIISDSPELWDTDVCFLHIQLLGTDVRLPKMHKIPSSRGPILSPQGHQQCLNLEITPTDNAEPCHPYDKIVGSHLCDEYVKSNEPNVCHMLLTVRANFSTGQKNVRPTNSCPIQAFHDNL